MKIDIWSDIRCPFCYIGKRKLEAGLEKFAHKDEVDIVWHSFELDPSLKTEPGKNTYDHLAEIKGQSREWSVQMHDQVAQMASQSGLTFNFNDAIVANSFNAHRLIQLAHTKNLASVAEEKLFKAYFTEGKNIDDQDTLVALGIEIGLNENEIKEMLLGNSYAKAVKDDQAIAQSIGVRGVPFFVFNDHYSISGAQPVEAFIQTLEATWKEFEKASQLNAADLAEGETCTPGGDC